MCRMQLEFPFLTGQTQTEGFFITKTSHFKNTDKCNSVIIFSGKCFPEPTWGETNLIFLTINQPEHSIHQNTYKSGGNRRSVCTNPQVGMNQIRPRRGRKILPPF